jgi:3-hydroxyisobutyrate dehydrogenase
MIGIGAMGMPMARHLHELGYRVQVRDIRAAAEDEARAAGMSVCASPAAMRDCVDLVVIVVVNAAQIDDVLSGVDGLLSAGDDALQQRHACTVMLCSTIAPQDAADFASQLVMRDMACIDAPISGGPARARDGSMSMMLAAPHATLNEWSGVLADMASRRFVISQVPGDGAKAKLVNNMLAGTNLVAGAEALALAQKLGLDGHLMFDVINASSGASWVFADRMKRALEGDYEPRAAASILTKDVGLATTMARSVDHATPLADAALVRFKATLAQGWADLDDAAVIKTWQGQ